MKLSRNIWTIVPLGAMAAVLLTPVMARADAPPASSTEQLVSSVLTLKQIGKLGLTQAQLREIIQRLSTLSHAQQVFAGHQAEAARPVLEPLHRIKTALQAGNTPDTADQTAVDQALAGLRTEQIHVEQLRTETIRAIRQALTANQMDTLHGFLGMDASNGGGGANGDMFYFEPQLRIDNKLNRNTEGGIAPVPLDMALPVAPQVKVQPPEDAARPVPQVDLVDPNLPADLVPEAAAAQRQLADAAADVAVTAQKELVQALRVAGAAPTPEQQIDNTAAAPAPAPPQPGDQEINDRMAKLEAEMAQMERMLQKLLNANGAAPGVRRELKPRIMHDFKLLPPAPGNPEIKGQIVMTPPVQEFGDKRVFGNVYVTNGGGTDDDVIARFFLQPDMLTYLKSLAAR